MTNTHNGEVKSRIHRSRARSFGLSYRTQNVAQFANSTRNAAKRAYPNACRPI
jgi:hypothetical protein